MTHKVTNLMVQVLYVSAPINNVVNAHVAHINVIAYLKKHFKQVLKISNVHKTAPKKIIM